MLVKQNENRGFQFKMWTEDQLDRLHQASLQILERTGVKVYDEEALGLLKEAGAYVEEELVRIPAYLVEAALRTAPSQFSLHNTDGSREMLLSKDRIYFGTGTDMPYHVDPDTQEIRLALFQDCINSSIVGHCCKNIDWIAPMALSSDLPSQMADLYQFKAMRTYSNKPNLIVPGNKENLKAIIDMAAVSAGGYEELRRKPTFIEYAEPTSPLLNSKDALQKLMMCADYGIPVLYAPAIMSGATGPVALTGTMAQGNAECLAGLVVHQLKKAGAPFIYGATFCIMDMKTTLCCYGGPEIAIVHSLVGAMGDYYNLPSFGSSGCTDAVELDFQAGAEFMCSTLSAALGATTIVHDNGYIAAGMLGSLEAILASDEVISFVKHFSKGVEISDETLCLDLIDEIGPGGNFIEAPHTFQNFRKEQWYPETWNRRSLEGWERAGKPDIQSSLTKKVRKMLEGEIETFLTKEQSDACDVIIAEHEKGI